MMTVAIKHVQKQFSHSISNPHFCLLFYLISMNASFSSIIIPCPNKSVLITLNRFWFDYFTNDYYIIVNLLVVQCYSFSFSFHNTIQPSLLMFKLYDLCFL
eukprot:196162_1